MMMVQGISIEKCKSSTRWQPKDWILYMN
jgi:hypothetical protein